MPRYLSPEWVESFDAALSTLDLSEAVAAAGAGSLAAADGRFSVVQVVTGVPDDVRGTRAGDADGDDGHGGGGGGGDGDEDVHLVLTVADGRARLELDPTRTTGGTATIVLGYQEALAMARGDLDPADALAAGRVRVRGDLAALVAGQDVLAEATARLGTVLEGLTDPPAASP